jgi:hypothetical protein
MLLDGITKCRQMYEEGFIQIKGEGFVITDVEMSMDNNLQEEIN